MVRFECWALMLSVQTRRSGSSSQGDEVEDKMECTKVPATWQDGDRRVS